MAEDDHVPRKGLDEVRAPLVGMNRDVDAVEARLNAYLVQRPALRGRRAISKSSRSREGEFARALIAGRRLRDQLFGTDLFSEPVWDMLLDLFAANDEQEKVSISSLCVAAAVPASTALRWITNLTARGMVVRQQDPHDGRRIWIELSPQVEEQMRQLLRVWIARQE